MLSEQDFRSIITLYRTGSFHKAADSLFISQPALSTSISNLEKRLGITLFERSKKGIKPTPACESIIPQAQKILEQIYEFKVICSAYNLINDPALAKTPITISSYPLMTSSVLPEIISQLKLHLPYLNIIINSLNHTQDIPIPRKDEIIIYYSNNNNELEFPENIKSDIICDVDINILLHKDYFNPIPKYIDEKELINLPIITILKNQQTSSIVTNSIINHLLTLKPDLNLIDTPSIPICFAFLKKKLGVSFNIQFETVKPHTAEKELLTIPLRHSNPEKFSLSICYADDISPELISLIINLIKQCLLMDI